MAVEGTRVLISGFTLNLKYALHESEPVAPDKDERKEMLMTKRNTARFISSTFSLFVQTAQYIKRLRRSQFFPSVIKTPNGSGVVLYHLICLKALISPLVELS